MQIKVTSLVTIKKIIRKRSGKTEDELLHLLSPAAASAFRTLETLEGIPIEQEAEIIATAASLLFPDQPSPVRQLGQEVARLQFSGILKASLLLPTLTHLLRHSLQTLPASDPSEAPVKDFSALAFVMERLPLIWHAFFFEGEAALADLTSTSGTLVVRGLPEMPPVTREYFCGFLVTLLELMGAAQVKVAKDDADPQAWKWNLRWEWKTPGQAAGTGGEPGSPAAPTSK